MAKKKKSTSSILNRRARFDYELSDEIVVGIVLTGPEVRAARDGHVQLRGAYVNLVNGELFLVNASFSMKLNQKGSTDRTVDTTQRKLLAHKKQIESLAAQKKVGLTIVPLRLLIGDRHIKLVIALGKGKKNYDKRETLKRRDQQREADKAVKR